VVERGEKVTVRPSRKVDRLTTARTATGQNTFQMSERRDLPVVATGAACTAISGGVTGIDQGLKGQPGVL
jgi:hypothetical protein